MSMFRSRGPGFRGLTVRRTVKTILERHILYAGKPRRRLAAYDDLTTIRAETGGNRER
jgi:hypothetical protein